MLNLNEEEYLREELKTQHERMEDMIRANTRLGVILFVLIIYAVGATLTMFVRYSQLQDLNKEYEYYRTKYEEMLYEDE